jgi:hypothetical protein
MIWFLGTISERLKAVVIPDECPNQEPLRAGERVVGVMPDDIKQLYVLLHEAWKKKQRIESDTTTHPCTPTDDGPNGFTRTFRAEIEHQTLVTCFWESVRESIPGAADVSLNTRGNWQIVTSSPLPEEQLSSRLYAQQNTDVPE